MRLNGVRSLTALTASAVLLLSACARVNRIGYSWAQMRGDDIPDIFITSQILDEDLAKERLADLCSYDRAVGFYHRTDSCVLSVLDSQAVSEDALISGAQQALWDGRADCGLIRASAKNTSCTKMKSTGFLSKPVDFCRALC